MHEIHIEQRFSAPLEKVFDRITDHAGMTDWAEGATVTIETPGTPAPNGLGAVRKVSAPPVELLEEVVAWHPPGGETTAGFDYKIIKGGPLQNHLGTMRLHPQSDGTTLLDYRIRYDVPWYFGGPLLGGLVRTQLGGILSKGLAKLAAEL